MRELRPVLLISADTELCLRVLATLERCGVRVPVPLAATLEQARAQLRRGPLEVILLDAAVMGNRPLDPAVRELVRSAPVLLLARLRRAETESKMGDLVVANKLEVLSAAADIAAQAAAAVERRLRSRDAGSQEPAWTDLEAMPDDFGEVLRHEVNNPLTGILGNAELLLARRDSLPALAVQRLETIAELAVRLRETIRRLSNSWEGRRQHIRSA